MRHFAPPVQLKWQSCPQVTEHDEPPMHSYVQLPSQR